MNASVRIQEWTVSFQTECQEAYDYVLKMKAFFHIDDYECGHVTALGHPLLVFIDCPNLRLTYDASDNALTLEAPWKEMTEAGKTAPGRGPIGGTLLRMSLWLLTECLRQDAGQFLLHAAAVQLGGRSLLITGPSESGKTMLALSLCREHGASLIGNDEVLLQIAGDDLLIVRGDASFNLRYSSLVQYSQQMALRLFANGHEHRKPWELKRRVFPEELGLSGHREPMGLHKVAFARLDGTTHEVSHTILDTSVPGPLFEHKVALVKELSSLIRGGGFATFAHDLSLIDLFVPNMDTPRRARIRNSFIDALFRDGRSCTVRGSLHEVTRCLTEQFGDESYTTSRDTTLRSAKGETEGL